MRELYQKLQAASVQPWLDEEDLLPGQKWRIEIPKAIQSCDIILVCLSNRSVKKDGYIKREIEFALDIADKQPEDTIFIIPVRLEECDVPKRLSEWHWVNPFEPRGYWHLLRALQRRANSLGAQPIELPKEPEQPATQVVATEGAAPQIPIDLKSLQEKLVLYFNKEELEKLCLDLGVQPEFLPPRDSGIEIWAMKTIGYFERRGSLDQLIARCRMLRPRVSWPWPLPKEPEQPATQIIATETEGTTPQMLYRADTESLRQMLVATFSFDELELLCVDLGVNPESVPQRDGGIGIWTKQIVLHFERRGRLAELINRCRELRPAVPWPYIDV